MGSSLFLNKTCLFTQKTFIFTSQEAQGISLEVRELSEWVSAAIWAREVNCGFLLITWPVSKTPSLPFHVCQWPIWLFYLSKLLPSLLLKLCWVSCSKNRYLFCPSRIRIQSQIWGELLILVGWTIGLWSPIISILTKGSILHACRYISHWNTSWISILFWDINAFFLRKYIVVFLIFYHVL